MLRPAWSEGEQVDRRDAQGLGQRLDGAEVHVLIALLDVGDPRLTLADSPPQLDLREARGVAKVAHRRADPLVKRKRGHGAQYQDV